MAKAVQNLVIGGGAAGVSISYLLQEQDTLLLESSPAIGGFCGTMTWKDCLFDMGGHVLTTQHEDVLEFLSSRVPLYFQPRRAFIAHKNQIIRYPFQKYFGDMKNVDIVTQCEKNDGRGDFPDPKDFSEYLINSLGHGIFAEFAQPYNEKLWGKPLSRMSPEWGKERVAPRKGAQNVSSGLDRLPLTSESVVGYPEIGGFATIFETLAKPLKRFRTQTGVKRIDVERRRVECHNGEEFEYSRLISTIPLDKMLGMTVGLPDEVVGYSKELEAANLRIVLLKHAGQLPLGIHRLYVAEADIPPHKIVFPNTSSPFLAEKPRHGIMGEVSEAGNSHLSDQEVVKLFVDGLVRLGILKTSSEITNSIVLSLPKAYPVQTKSKSQILKLTRFELGKKNIHLLGRFAEWDYINSDQVIKRALVLANTLARDTLNAYAIDGD